MNNYNDQEQSNYTPKLYRETPFDLRTKTLKTKINNQPPPIRNNSAVKKSSESHFLTEKNKNLFLKFAPHLEKVTFTGNDSIYQSGDKIDYVYFPQSSIFSEFQILEDGATIEIAMTGNEGIIGLSSILHTNPATNWTQISAPGTALRLKSKILREEANTNRELQQILYGCVGSYIKQISQRLVCNKYHLLEKRLCSWLLMMQDRFKGTKLPLTQEQMARILGANRPSVSNIAHSLRVAEIIDYRRGSLIIRNRTKLESRACRCFAEIDENLEKIF